MPYKDPEKARESGRKAQRRYREKHSDDPEYIRKNREGSAAWRQANPDRARPDRQSTRTRQLRYLFGIEPHDLTRRWDEQRGCCYLCGEPLDWEAKRGFVVDHDRSHCRGKRSCGDCILGLACDNCNVGCGRFGDDPDRMERAAAARRAAMAKVAEKISALPVQAELPINVAPLERRKEVS